MLLETKVQNGAAPSISDEIAVRGYCTRSMLWNAEYHRPFAIFLQLLATSGFFVFPAFVLRSSRRRAAPMAPDLRFVEAGFLQRSTRYSAIYSLATFAASFRLAMAAAVLGETARSTTRLNYHLSVRWEGDPSIHSFPQSSFS